MQYHGSPVSKSQDQSEANRLVKGNEAGLTKLRLANHQDTAFEIDIRLLESERLAGPHSGSRQESDERDGRDGFQPFGRREPRGFGQ